MDGAWYPAPAPDKRGRRRSWHVKMERKRRKGVMGGVDDGADRRKRVSWWNIFVPEHWPSRSRRASQDLPRATEHGAAPWLRSKSRSVDHGFSPPFDLDSLRSKVEDRLSRDSDGGPKEPSVDKKAAKIMLPINTTTYTVSSSDTLTSVAARFDTTPSELAELNRLATRLVFPGQLLHVPLKAGTGAVGEEAAAPDCAPEVARQDVAAAAGTGVVTVMDRSDTPERSSTPLLGQASVCEVATTERRFLKINVRHITDGQGVVGGVLLVTPNAVMFDPNVSDPLVIEHGPESYGVIAPMEFVANAAIYYDIAHMRVGSSVDAARACGQKAEVYHGRGPRSPGKDSLLVKDETFPELAPDEDNESVCSCPGRGGDAFPKAFERDLVTPTNMQLLSSSSSSDRREEEDAGSSRQISLDSCASSSIAVATEERRRSCLDQHWAIPSTDRGSMDKESSAADGSGDATEQAINPLVKLSCHDSGIDIRDTGVTDQASATCAPVAARASRTKEGRSEEDGEQTLQQEGEAEVDGEEEEEVIVPSKKVFSDADVIHAPKMEWVLPVTAYGGGSLDAGLACADASRKKASSVSFSLESNPEADAKDTREEGHKGEDADKQESRKNKMLKRLSYPLTWMEGLTSDKDDKDALAGGTQAPAPAPAAGADSQHHGSVFSKVFSSSPISLVDFGTGLFLTKTPSEESTSSRSPGPGPPPPTPAALPAATQPSDGRSSVGTFMRHHDSRQVVQTKPAVPKLDYRSMVSVEDMPELFVSFDIHAPHYPVLDDLELIPRPARSCEDPPLYLRLRMGKPRDRKIPRSTPIMSYGKKKMRPEYWFSVPRNRVDELYNFLVVWVPHLYGDLEDADPQALGYELVESDTELWDDDDTDTGNDAKGRERTGSGGDEAELADLTRESWEVLKAPYVKLYSILKTQTVPSEGEAVEVLSMSEELRRALYAGSVTSLDMEAFVPDLVGVTEVLSEEHRRALTAHLPARAEGYVWTLVFSTSQHGFSLKSMYRKMTRLESPILMVIEDTEHNVFGALTSCALKVSDHFYGTGESLLYRFRGGLEIFPWSGENGYFIKGNHESLALGAGDGRFGLWLDGDLYQGRSQACTTYGNPPLAPHEDFVVKTLECWAFI